MAEVTRDEVLAALGKIIDPDKGQDIVTLGMVSGVQIRADYGPLGRVEVSFPR